MGTFVNQKKYPYVDKKIIKQYFDEYEGELQADTIKKYRRVIYEFAEYLETIGKKEPDDKDVKAFFLERLANGISLTTIQKCDYAAFVKYGLKVYYHGENNIIYGKGKDYFLEGLKDKPKKEEPKPNPYKLIFEALKADVSAYVQALASIANDNSAGKNEAIVILAGKIGEMAE